MLTAEEVTSTKLLIDRVLTNIKLHSFYEPASNAEARHLLQFGFSSNEFGIVFPPEIELLDATSIRANFQESKLQTTIDLQVVPCIGSTNSELLSLAESESIDRRVLLAELQIQGRGRFSRDWFSPFGQNLALSIGVELTVSPSEVSALSLVAGIAVAQTLIALDIENISLKWPNDVLLNGLKVGGILVELFSASSPMIAVIGIGLNYGSGQQLSDQLEGSVGDLTDRLERPARNRLCAGLIESVYTHVAHFNQEGFKAFLTQWNQLDALARKPVTVSMDNAEFTGTAKGIREDGALLICDSNGVQQALVAGDVSVREAK